MGAQDGEAATKTVSGKEMNDHGWKKYPGKTSQSGYFCEYSLEPSDENDDMDSLQALYDIRLALL
jgi:hypothetical protein